MSVPLMSELIRQKVSHYDLRNPYEFFILNFKSVFHGQGSISYLGPLICEFKDLNTVSALKQLLRNGSQGTVKRILEMLRLLKFSCLGLTIDAGWSAGIFSPGFLVEGFSVSGRLVFLKCFIFTFMFLLFKFVFKKFIFSPLFLLM